MTNHFAVRSSADWLYTNSHNAPPRDHYRVSIGPVFTFGGRAEVAKAAIGTTAATATTKNPAAFRPVVPVPALGIQVTTRDEGGTEIAEVASGSAAELANLHVGYVITSVDEKPVNTPMELTADLQNRTPGSQVRLGYMFHSSALGYFPKETVVILAGSK